MKVSYYYEEKIIINKIEKEKMRFLNIIKKISFEYPKNILFAPYNFYQWIIFLIFQEEKEKKRWPYTRFWKKRGVTKTRILFVNEFFTTIKSWATLPIIQNNNYTTKRIELITADFRYKKNLLIITLPSNSDKISSKLTKFLREIYKNYAKFEKNDTLIFLVTKETTFEMKLSCLKTLNQKTKRKKQLPPIPIITDHYFLFEVYFNTQMEGLGRKTCDYYMFFILDKNNFVRHANYSNKDILIDIKTLIKLTHDINQSY